MKLYEELAARGLIAQVTNEDEIREMINAGKATFYIGFDCTADSLTAGHFVALTFMKRLQQAGNKPIALIGGGTTMIGDPSGRTDMRKMLTKEDIDHNAECLKRQMEKFIDFGADIRFRDAKTWEKWYHLEHPDHQMTKDAVYCIPEVMRDLAKGASLISNPGCYPTASTLGLMPILKEGMVVDNTSIVDAKSGFTGAGRRPAPNKLMAEASNSFCAYALGGSHRHTPEIEQNIAYITGKDLMKPETWQFINFQPHLTPQIRGIEVTLYATLNKDTSDEELFELYNRYYKDEPFIHVLPASKPVQTKWTAGTNLCCITPTFDKRTKRAVISSVIDNIGKGAAGQAIQNMNIIFDLPETTGLMIPPMYP